MDESFGPIFKKIRQKKGFKANEVAKDIVSVQFLRRFEKGEADIRLSNFYELLKRINLSFADFMYSYYEETLDRALDDFDVKLDKAVLSGDNIALTNMMEEYRQLYQKTGEIRYLHFNIICKIYCNQVFHTHFDFDKDAIFDYLDKCEIWTKYEFFIASLTVDLFSMNALHNLTIMALDVNNNGCKYIDDFALDFCFHAALTLIKNDKDDYAKNIIEHYYSNKNIKKVLVHLGFNIAIRFLEGILMARNGEEAGHKICTDIITFYHDTIDYKGYANNLHKYYMRLTHKR